ncbi:class I SAM-dependent methyltransferase [Streptosporangium roseum]|uniref:class I SAM-dependent methyltransferase n=1 Tax=Streptosporangium roseum TaxID=2001 RepID=UPI0033194A0F
MTSVWSAERLDAWVRLIEGHPEVLSARLLPGPEPRIDVVPRSLVTETVEGWQYVFDDLYESVAEASGGRDPRYAGWIDGLTGQAVPDAEMKEWADAVVGRIRALRPRRILEIGAGTGMVMSRLLTDAGLEEYVATDFAPSSLAMLRATRDARVRVLQAAAHDELPASEGGAYDTVVLNSVIQYFPSIDYLEDVIASAVALTAEGGHVFLGDLRDTTLLETYYCQCAARSGTDFDLEFHQRRDYELSVSPDYVRSLGRRFEAVTAVEAASKQGRFRNEMTLFRFDAVLHLGCQPPDDHFRLPSPSGTDSPAPKQAPLPPGRAWSLLDSLTALAGSTGGDLPDIRFRQRPIGDIEGKEAEHG